MQRRLWAVIVAALLALAAVGTLTLGQAQPKTTHHGAHQTAASDTGFDDVTAFAMLPVDEIARQAAREMKALKAVHYKGSMVVHGGRLALVGGVDDQGHCKVTLGAPGAAMEVRHASHAYFIRFDRAILMAHPELLARAHVSQALIDAISGKWWEVPGDSVPEFSPMCTLRTRGSLVEAMVKALGLTLVKGEVSRLAGRLVVRLVPTQYATELWVAVTGKHRIVRISDGSDGDEVDSLDLILKGFDHPVKVTVPPHRLLPGYSQV